MDSNSFSAFAQLIETLRKECPWDREQTHQTLKKYLLEEAYEFFDSVDKNNDIEMIEELGDILLQVVLHSTIAKERGAFTLDQVIRKIHDKMVVRHPHVFDKEKATTSTEVKANWEKIKKKEKILSGVPNHLPSLLKAYRIGEKVASLGFDWKNATDAFEKVKEELEEVKQAQNKTELEEEIGDLLFAISSYSRLSKIDPEEALQKALKKFQNRFESIENEIKKCKNLEEMEELWQRTKSE